MKLYVGCALTHVPGHFLTQVTILKQGLRNKGFEVLEFLGVVAGTPRDVYQQDIGECVEKCDFMVAVCDHSSIGLGIEMNHALFVRKVPVLAVAKQGARVSRLVEGIPHQNFCFERYDHMSRDVPDLLEERLAHCKK
jgi:hypothetical protein